MLIIEHTGFKVLSRRLNFIKLLFQFKNGCIAVIRNRFYTFFYDFSVSAQEFEDGTPENIAKRIYAGSGFRYKPQNAIHTIYVNGEVQKSEVER